MIVPAKPLFFDAGRFERGNLKDGETFSIDSGMGGSWTVEFLGYDRHNHLVFRSKARPEWPAENFYFTNAADAARNLYCLVPENLNY